MKHEIGAMVCRVCFARRPLEFFKSPDTTCVDCRTRSQAIEQNTFVETKAKEVMNRLLDENFVPTAGLTPLVEVMSEVYQCFGGPRQFASQMYEQMMEVLKKKPASPSSVGLFLRFMQLQLKVEEKIQEQETSDMTDEQLRREQEIGLMKMFLDAAGDPQRRKMLDRLLGLQGIKLTNMTPEQVLHDGSGIQTSEQVEPGVGAS